MHIRKMYPPNKPEEANVAKQAVRFLVGATVGAFYADALYRTFSLDIAPDEETRSFHRFSVLWMALCGGVLGLFVSTKEKP